MISIGIDLHVDNSYVTALNADTGEILEGVRVANTNAALRAYFRQFEGQRMKAIVEATGNTYPLVCLLRQIEGVEICVVNPRKMRIIADSVCKTDKIDSEVLAEFGLSRFKLPQSFIPGQEAHDLRSLLRLRVSLVEMQTGIKNQVRSLINAEGFLSPPEKLYSNAGRRWLEELDVVEEAQVRVHLLLRMLDNLHVEILYIEKRLRERYAKHPVWEADLKILRSMPGIGPLTSLTILAELGDWQRFKSPAAVSCYAGLVPRVDVSNQKCHYGKITKEGPRCLRWILSEAALTAIKYVPRYRVLYDKISLSSPHGSGAAQIALGRRMLEDAWIMLRKRELFKFEIQKPVRKCAPRSGGA